MAKVEAIIFDCFGVIVADSLQLITDRLRAENRTAAEHIDDIIRANNRGLIEPPESSRQIAAILGISIDELHVQMSGGEIKNQALLEYIVSLRATYKIAMLSNIGAMSLHKRFTEQELAKHFDTVVVSGEIGYAKPEPEAYEITADRLGVRLDACVFTDDREHFCEAARAVGMQAIHYQNVDQFRQDLEGVLSHE